MRRSDIDIHFVKIDDFIGEINDLVPISNYKTIQFRSDLAGLSVVAMAATYETCVKETLYDFANRHYVAFRNFFLRNFNKINSRIQVSDLKKYCETFDPIVCTYFKEELKQRKNLLLQRVGRNIKSSYEQILSWRHNFAHAGIRNTTIEEAATTHRFAKRINYIFNEAFSKT